MTKGNSVPWPDILREFTDGQSDQIDPSSMLAYFEPLYVWLKKQNLKDINWNCDSYIDDTNKIIKSYDFETETSNVSRAASFYLFNYKNSILFFSLFILNFYLFACL